MDSLITHLVHVFGGANPKRPLSLEEAASGLTACFENGVALIEDARNLVRGDRWARAAALLVLAIEELAKVPDLHDTAVRVAVSGSDDEWTGFWRRFQSHESKQKRMAEYGKWLTASLGGATFWENPGPYSDFLPEDLGRSLDVFKQRTFYVDFWDNRFVVPGSVPSDLPAVVDALYALALERADSFAGLHASQARSRALLEEHIAASQGATKIRREPRRAGSDGSDANEVRIDLHSLLANRSSAAIPDYQAVYKHAEAVTAQVADEIVREAARVEAQVLADRISEKRLRTAGWRAWKMLKLLYGFAERNGIEFELPELGGNVEDGAEA